MFDIWLKFKILLYYAEIQLILVYFCRITQMKHSHSARTSTAIKELWYTFLIIWLRLLTIKKIQNNRSSGPEVFCKKDVLKNFAKFTGKHLCQSIFFNKVAGLAQVFSCEFCKILKNTFFTEHLRGCSWHKVNKLNRTKVSAIPQNYCWWNILFVMIYTQVIGSCKT